MELKERAFVSAENNTKTFLMMSAITMAGLLASGQHSYSMYLATLCLSIGILDFMLTLMFIVTVQMNVVEGSVIFGDEVRSGRISITFMVGTLAYAFSFIYICVHAARMAH